MNLNDSGDLFEDIDSDDDFEDFMSGLPEEVMDGSQPLPDQVGLLSSSEVFFSVFWLASVYERNIFIFSSILLIIDSSHIFLVVYIKKSF